jgi:TonB family protein
MAFELHRPSFLARVRGSALAIASLAVHAVLLLALIASAMWQVDKLRPDETDVVIGAAVAAPAAPAAAPPRTALEKPTHLVREPRQPSTRPPVEVPDDPGPAGPGGDGPPGGPPGPASDGPPCPPNQDCRPPPPQIRAPIAPPAPPRGPKAVAPGVLEAQRISGNPRIMPPDSVRMTMARADVHQLVGVVRMCIDRQGRVASLHLVRSTGHPAYDDRLLSGMRGWTYRPFQLTTGEAVAACTAVTFHYRTE